MKQVFLIITSIFLWSACNTTINSDLGDVIAKVGEHVLTEKSYRAVFPENTNSEDSLIISENIIKTWSKEMLMYDLAQDNIQDKERINQLVENYRKSLITYQYQEQLINEKMSDEISEADMQKYYNENKDKFKLENTLIKGLFLKIPIDAPQIDKVKAWYRSQSINDIENIEKYSLQNAVNYDYFYDRWVRLDDIMQLFPAPWSNPETLIRVQKQIEVQDSLFCYFLNIRGVRFIGEEEPYEYTKNNIKEILINQKRMDFLRNFEEELYQMAVRKGKINRIKDKD